jgi:hypothetical protein
MTGKSKLTTLVLHPCRTVDAQAKGKAVEFQSCRDDWFPYRKYQTMRVIHEVNTIEKTYATAKALCDRAFFTGPKSRSFAIGPDGRNCAAVNRSALSDLVRISKYVPDEWISAPNLVLTAYQCSRYHSLSTLLLLTFRTQRTAKALEVSRDAWRTTRTNRVHQPTSTSREVSRLADTLC